MPEDKITNNEVSENASPSDTSKKAIKDGVNWLKDWYTSRYNQGYMTKQAFDEAISQLKNIKIYTTKQGYNRITEEIKNGTLHFYERLQRKGMSAEHWENFVQKNNTFPLGFNANRYLKEPVVFIDFDPLKKERGDNPQYISSIIIHELTHQTAPTNDSEYYTDLAFQGMDTEQFVQRHKKFNLEHLSQKEAIADITPQIMQDTDTPLVKPETQNKSQTKANSEYQESMLEGVEPNAYLDSKVEIYARIMQLRYDFGLKPDEPFTEEHLEKIKKRAEAAHAENRLKTDTDKSYRADIDYFILNRYTPEVIKKVMNSTVQINAAESEKALRQSLKNQEYLASVQGKISSPDKNDDIAERFAQRAAQKEKTKTTTKPRAQITLKPDTNEYA
ncbi:MAG: hypothetical protein J6B00_01915 [Alphaproteobacteria bacterium]|nr:hypothetical protein [Alphaproteobacteria bacterium]